MTEHPRRFVPSNWLEEHMPSPQEDVNTFVRQFPDGEFWIGPAGDEWGDYDSFYKDQLSRGQIIKFSALEIYENVTLDVSADGFTHFPNHFARANNFRLDDGECEDIFENIEALVAAGNEGGRLAERSYEVECWWWSDEDFCHRFVIDTDGKGTLVPCAGAN